MGAVFCQTGVLIWCIIAILYLVAVKFCEQHIPQLMHLAKNKGGKFL